MPEIVKTSERLAYLTRQVEELVEELGARMTQLGELETRVAHLEAAARKPARATTAKTDKA
jgi:hypothetical protein